MNYCSSRTQTKCKWSKRNVFQLCMFFTKFCNALAGAEIKVHVYTEYLCLFFINVIPWIGTATAAWHSGKTSLTAKLNRVLLLVLGTRQVGYRTRCRSFQAGLLYPQMCYRPRVKMMLGILPDPAGLETCGMQLLGPITADWWLSVRGTQTGLWQTVIWISITFFQNLLWKKKSTNICCLDKELRP